jgi:hypothetical protein
VAPLHRPSPADPIPDAAPGGGYCDSFFFAKSARKRKIKKIMSAAPNRNLAMAALPAAIPVNPKIAAMTEMMAKMIAHLIIDRSNCDAPIFRLARVLEQQT